MEWHGFTVQCPLVLGGSVNEAEVLGATVWLWMHSVRHREAPLEALPELLLPAIRQRQYVLACRDSRPVFFMSWAGWMRRLNNDISRAGHYWCRRQHGRAVSGCGSSIGLLPLAIPGR